jgi:hypothetical protein
MKPTSNNINPDITKPPKAQIVVTPSAPNLKNPEVI